MSDLSSRPGARGESLYRFLLRLFPREFRARYTDDMVDFYRERMATARRTGTATARVWPRLVFDLLSSAAAERAVHVARSRHRPYTAPDPNRRPEEAMSILLQDIHYALRGMARRPGFTAVILATLALGIGANAAIFTVVNAVLLRPLPFAHVERIVHFEHAPPLGSVSEGEFVDYQRDIKAFAKTAAYNQPTVTLGVGDESIRADGSRVSRDFFDILGVAPMLGRVFAPDEYSHLVKTRITVISNGLWRQQFAGDPKVIGKTLTINGTQFTIIGVMPSGFNFPEPNVAFWTAWRLNVDSLWTRNNHYLHVVAQLAPGATIEQARVQANTLDHRWLTEFPSIYNPKTPLVASITPIRDHVLGATQPYLLALLGAVAFILLIACVNVANLLLVRGESRRKEFAIRTALGASGSRMVRQMLTESMLLATIGAVLGAGVAWGGARGLVALAPGSVPRLDEIGVDVRVVLFTIGVTVVTGLLFGLVPAMRGMHGDSTGTLRDGGKTSSVGASRVVRRSLVAAEIALAVMMLSGAGLLIRSLIKLRAVDLGFAPEHVLTMELTIPPRRQYTDTSTDELFRQIRQRVSHLPGVESAAFDGALPISGGDSDWSIMIDGRELATIGEAPGARPDQVTPDYFKVMSTPLLRGRVVAEEDRMGAPAVVVINQTMAKRLWPGVDPIGHTLKMFSPNAPWVTIVGVVADTRSRGFQGTIPPTMYFPLSQAASSAYYMPATMTLVVRAAGDPALLTPSIRNVVRSLEPRLAIANVATMDEVVGQSIANRTFTTILLAGFAGLALALAGIGIYGVISFGVSQRTYEIGVRMALGASRGSVVQLVVGEGIRMAIAGLVIGLAGAVVVDRLLNSMLVGVSTTDAPTLAGVIVTLAAVAASACALPARRATAVSPTEALRNG